MKLGAPVQHAAQIKPVSRAGLREQVTQRILDSVFERRLVSGQRLIVQRLAEMYRVSPTPVRESLVELAGLGIVDLLPNRGAVVNAFGQDQLQQLSQVRRVLEMEAARAACGRIPREALETLRKQLESLQSMPQNDEWDEQARDADSRLHHLVADACGNPYLAREIGKSLTLFRSLRNVSHLRDSLNDYRRSNDVPEHLEIVNALLAGDPEASARAMDRHIRSITKVLGDVVYPE